MRPRVNGTWSRNATAPAPLATTMAVPATPATTRAAPLVGHALRPPRPTGECPSTRWTLLRGFPEPLSSPLQGWQRYNCGRCLTWRRNSRLERAYCLCQPCEQPARIGHHDETRNDRPSLSRECWVVGRIAPMIQREKGRYYAQILYSHKVEWEIRKGM